MSADLTEAVINLLPDRHHEGAIAFLKYITKACFIQGLHDERIQTVVRARDEKILLPNAVEVALEEESAILSGKYKRNVMPQKQFLFAKKETGKYRTGDPRKDRKDKKPLRVHVICYKCQKEGHIAAECRNTPKCGKCSRCGGRKQVIVGVRAGKETGCRRVRANRVFRESNKGLQ
jgi:hypothetical protein